MMPQSASAGATLVATTITIASNREGVRPCPCIGGKRRWRVREKHSRSRLHRAQTVGASSLATHHTVVAMAQLLS